LPASNDHYLTCKYFFMYHDQTTALPSQDLFTEEDLYTYELASIGQRFLNFLIDAIIIQWGLAYATGIVLGYVLVSFFPETAYAFFIEKSQSTVLLISYAIGIVNYLIYYSFCESIFNGVTLGKLITGTKAVCINGEKIRFKTALLRSLSRIVPFEPFSIWFGEGIWHDKWTNTMVVKKR
jgi:uncharacterized RDD family membrane protein YckC